MQAKEFFLKFSRVFLIAVNALVVVLGIAALIVGIVEADKDRDYTDITGENRDYKSVAILLLVIGLLVIIIGVLGFVGAFCGTKLAGRIMLFVYGVVVGILVVMAISGGIAAAVQRDKLRDLFYREANQTLHETPGNREYQDDWDYTQDQLECCGVSSYTDWLSVLWFNNVTLNAVPASCCSGDCGAQFYITKAEIDSGTYTVYGEGCVEKIVNTISDDIAPIAGIGITLAIVMVAAVLMAFAVAFFNPQTTYEMV